MPKGFREILNWIKNEYGDPRVIITESGCSDYGGLDDPIRINYYVVRY
jgi:beta-glucosidase/6-phospho-beta-glucosidase/beta-galactosidase